MSVNIFSFKLFSLKKQPDRESDRGYEEIFGSMIKNKKVLYCTTSKHGPHCIALWWSLFINFIDIDNCLDIISERLCSVILMQEVSRPPPSYISMFQCSQCWDVAGLMSRGNSGSLLFFYPTPDPTSQTPLRTRTRVKAEPGEKTGAAPLWVVRSKIVLAHHLPQAGRENQVGLVLTEP